MDKRVITKAIAAQLRAERAVAMVSQRQLAEELGISLNSTQRYESGEREIPAVLLLQALAILDVQSPRFFRAVDERIQDLQE